MFVSSSPAARPHLCSPVSRAHIDCAPSKSSEIGPIRFTNGQASPGICLHNTIRTHVLNILSALKGRFHNKALCCTGEERLGWRIDGLQYPAGKTIALGLGNLLPCHSFKDTFLHWGGEPHFSNKNIFAGIFHGDMLGNLSGLIVYLLRSFLTIKEEFGLFSSAETNTHATVSHVLYFF